MMRYSPQENGKKPRNIESLAIYSFNEWLKYQRYAENNL